MKRYKLKIAGSYHTLVLDGILLTSNGNDEYSYATIATMRKANEVWTGCAWLHPEEDHNGRMGEKMAFERMANDYANYHLVKWLRANENLEDAFYPSDFVATVKNIKSQVYNAFLSAGGEFGERKQPITLEDEVNRMLTEAAAAQWAEENDMTWDDLFDEEGRLIP